MPLLPGFNVTRKQAMALQSELRERVVGVDRLSLYKAQRSPGA